MATVAQAVAEWAAQSLPHIEVTSVYSLLEWSGYVVEFCLCVYVCDCLLNRRHVPAFSAAVLFPGLPVHRRVERTCMQNFVCASCVCMKLSQAENRVDAFSIKGDSDW